MNDGASLLLKIVHIRETVNHHEQAVSADEQNQKRRDISLEEVSVERRRQRSASLRFEIGRK